MPARDPRTHHTQLVMDMLDSQLPVAQPGGGWTTSPALLPPQLLLSLSADPVVATKALGNLDFAGITSPEVHQAVVKVLAKRFKVGGVRMVRGARVEDVLFGRVHIR